MSSSSETPQVSKNQEVKENKSNNEGNPECAVCLQTSIHPVQLPCSHIFCYLCVKGVTNHSKRCAMCRQEIPPDFLDSPHLLSSENLESNVVFEDGYQWFYEGRNGWWQYDERTSVELETAYKRGENRCEVLIAGFLYIINFEHMIQMRHCDQSRRRRIKRDLSTVPKKGVAGIRLPLPPHSNSDELNTSSTSSSTINEMDRNVNERHSVNSNSAVSEMDRNVNERLSVNYNRHNSVDSSSRQNSDYNRQHTVESSDNISVSASSHDNITTSTLVEEVSAFHLAAGETGRHLMNSRRRRISDSSVNVSTHSSVGSVASGEETSGFAFTRQ